MTKRDKLAIIAHDGRKADLTAWATFNRERLSGFDLVATATT
jgi:methylglyoxal synthase